MDLTQDGDEAALGDGQPVRVRAAGHRGPGRDGYTILRAMPEGPRPCILTARDAVDDKVTAGWTWA